MDLMECMCNMKFRFSAKNTQKQNKNMNIHLDE